MARTKPKPEASLMRRAIPAIALALVLLAAGSFWIYNLFNLQTDDAYVNANVVQVAARVPGQVARLPIDNNQMVEKGRVLFEIDPVPFIIAVDKAQAHVEEAEAKVKILKVTADRVNILAKDRVKSLEEQDKTSAALQEGMATLNHAKATLAHSQLDLSYTKVTAPATGWVTMLKLRAGDVVEANKTLFALVEQEKFWIDANFKENELQHISVGQQADIEVDMYPGHYFKGTVESISRGSGTAFSLLPPQNATGNWVKVTQRVPVKIRIPENNPDFPLRIGITATVKIRLHPDFWHSFWHKKAP